jgi:PAS domain-containing protein
MEPRGADTALLPERYLLATMMAIETGQPMVGIEEKETWPDGHETWVSTSKVPIRDASGNVIGTFGLSRDITERKISNEAMASYARQQEAVSHFTRPGSSKERQQS